MIVHSTGTEELHMYTKEQPISTKAIHSTGGKLIRQLFLVSFALRHLGRWCTVNKLRAGLDSDMLINLCLLTNDSNHRPTVHPLMKKRPADMKVEPEYSENEVSVKVKPNTQDTSSDMPPLPSLGNDLL